MTLVFILSATVLVSLISLVGVFTLGINKAAFNKVLVLFVGFAAGGLIGSSFLHLLPEAIAQRDCAVVFLYTLIGFTIFFLMERYLHWRHCHKGICDVHAFTYLNLIGDGVHNFTDGMIIAASFMTDLKLGVITTTAVALHEIPQEIGDFGILMYGGFSKPRALFFNLVCASTAILGAVIAYALSSITMKVSFFLISFTAGGFIYIAASDLIPELHRQEENKNANIAFLTFVLGLIFMWIVKLFPH